MQHDRALREAARAIYESIYPGEEWTPVPFDQAERLTERTARRGDFDWPLKIDREC